MKVSIIIPVYNVAPYIKACLDSVKKQTFRDFEVIIVDDCGTDESMDIIREYMSLDVFPKQRILSHKYNRGLSAARNTGLKAALGEYVLFLDSDDEITNDCLQVLTRHLDSFKYDFVIADYDVIEYDKEYPPLKLTEGELLENKNILYTYAQGLWYMMAWNKLCRREFLLNNHLLFDEGVLHEDVIWNFKLACKAQSMYVSMERTYKYRVRSASIMTNTSLEKDIEQYIKVFELMTSFVEAENRQEGVSEYRIIEGRKSTLLFSLLQKKEISLYKKYYSKLYDIRFISPLKAYFNGVIGGKYLLRDFHYILPVVLGRIYKYLFYLLFYKWQNKQIEGALW